MKPYPHTNMMTLKEWKKFVKNYDNPKCNWSWLGKPKPIKEVLEKYSRDFRSLISLSLGWHSTPEGQPYWKEIAYRKHPVS